MACDDGLNNDGVQEGAREALIALSSDFRIWIFTGSGLHLAYAKPHQRTKTSIEAFLRQNKIPFEKVLQIKPPACFIIDDRAIHHLSWKETMEEIANRKQKVKTNE